MRAGAETVACVDPPGAASSSIETAPPLGSAPCTRTLVRPSAEVTSAANARGARSAWNGTPPMAAVTVTVEPGDAISPALS